MNLWAYLAAVPGWAVVHMLAAGVGTGLACRGLAALVRAIRERAP